MSANAIETLRSYRHGDTRYDAALAAVEALLEAAKPLESYDLAAGPHDYHGYRLLPEADAKNLMRDLAALAAAVRRVESGQ